METGICRRCACNWITPCSDDLIGACWWMDIYRTLCSHCYWKLTEEELVSII